MVLLDLSEQELKRPVPDSDALPLLKVYTGFKCSKCSKILCDTKSIVGHLRTAHEIVRRGPGRPSLSPRALEKDWTNVTC